MRVLAVAGGKPALWPDFDLRDFDCFVGIDRGCLYLLEQEIPLDLAVGDFDSLDAAEKALVFAAAKQTHTSPAEKDDTDTQLALLQIFTDYPEAEVTLIGATGGRLDHLLGNIWLGVEPRFAPFLHQLRIKDRQNTVAYLDAGSYVITKEPAMKYLGYCCLTPVKELTLTESKYTLCCQDVATPFSYGSNEFVTDQAKISFSAGIIAVIQSRD